MAAEIITPTFCPHHKRIVGGHELWDQPEPPPEAVWDMCTYTRGSIDENDFRCRECPKWEQVDGHGESQRMCYGLAEEACRVAFAWQKRLDDK